MEKPNGVGPYWWPKKYRPKFLLHFEDAGNKHDTNYQDPKLTKETSDKLFLKDMLEKEGLHTEKEINHSKVLLAIILFYLVRSPLSIFSKKPEWLKRRMKDGKVK